MRRILIIGAGKWGLALASEFATAGDIEVDLVTRDPARVLELESCCAKNENLRVVLGLSGNSFECLFCIIIAVPADSLLDVCETLENFVSADVPIIAGCKGMDCGTLKMPGELLVSMFPRNPVFVIAGPSFASDLKNGLPCLVNIAGSSEVIGHYLSTCLSTVGFKIIYHGDFYGVQVASVVKNVIAIACGILYGHDVGDSCMSMAITKGAIEIVALYEAKTQLTCTLETLLSPAFLGDLIMTCSNLESRNMSLGFRIGKGELSLRDLQDQNYGVLSEGAHSVKSLILLADMLDVKIPICRIVNDIICGCVSLEEGLSMLQCEILS